MKADNIDVLSKAAKRYATTFGAVEKDAQVVEMCDFGDSYGFMFEAKDKFANLYWCIEKETYRPFSFRPNMDVNKYQKRKILPDKNGEGNA